MFFRTRCRIRRMRVDGSRIRKEKAADSKISGYVWTGPYLPPSAKQQRDQFLRCLKNVNHNSYFFRISIRTEHIRNIVSRGMLSFNTDRQTGQTCKA